MKEIMTATVWIGLGAIIAALIAAFIARELKISEFRQAWIEGLREDISSYVTEANKWMDKYLEFNAEQSQQLKREMAPILDSSKYAAFHVLRRIELRFKPDDTEANSLLLNLRDLLNPAKIPPPSQEAQWVRMADSVVRQSRVLLKEEWEVTKNRIWKLLK